MIDIKKIREDFDATAAQLARRGVEKERVQKAKDLDEKRRSLIAETETLKAKRNAASKEIGQIAKQGGDIFGFSDKTADKFKCSVYDLDLSCPLGLEP